MTHTTPEERDQQIAAMLRAGATYLQVINELCVSNGTVRRVRATLDIPVPPGRRGGRGKSDEERAAAIEERYPRAAAMLRAGHTHKQTAKACGIGTGTVSDIRRALNIPVPTGRSGPKGPRRNLDQERQALDDQIAERLTQGLTNADIRAELHVSGSRVTRVRRERRIPVPPKRVRRPPADIAAAEQEALTLLRAGAKVAEIRAATHLGLNAIAALRRAHNIPVPEHRPSSKARKRARTVDEVLDLHTQPYGDGHARWTGTRSGHQDIVCAESRRISARRATFQRHHQREPIGHVKNTCTEPGCLAGPHLTDDVIRSAHAHADQAFEQIFGDTP